MSPIRHPALLALFTCTCAIADLGAATGALDQQVFAVAFVDEAKARQGEDQLRFDDGKLVLPGIRKRYGFEPSTYTTKPTADGGLSFTATLTSAKHGSLAVSGTIVRDQATGTRTWSKGGKDAIVHAFTGTRAPAGK
jgi:hypothetical protein